MLLESTQPLSVHEAMQAVRLKRGLLQGDVAARIGVNRSTLTRYESGKIPVTALRLRAIAEALQVDPGLFFRLTYNDPELDTLPLMENKSDDA